MSIPDIVKRIPERTQLNHVPALDNELVFIAEDLPPMGFRSYFLEIEKSRTKRAITKNMAKNRRIISRMGNATENDDEYEQFIDFKQKPRPIIEFANISTYTESPKEYVDVVTPRYKDDLLEKAEAPHREFESDEEDTPRPDMQFLLPSRRMNLKRTTPIPYTPHRSTFTTEEPYIPQTAPPRTIQPSTETPKPPLTTTTSTTTEPIIQTTSPMYCDDEPEHTGSSDDEDEGEVSWAQEIAFRKLERAGYHSILSGDDFIKNEHIKINLNQKSGKIKSIALSNGVFMNLDIDMMYYVSDDPFKMKVKRKAPGAYVFRTMDPSPLRTGPNQQLKVLKSAFVQEAQIQFSSFSAATVRLYKNLPYVEVNWIVGPIFIQDGLGKEMFIRYSTDLINSGVLYTDSNGRQTIKRIKNMRPTYTPANLDPVAGNFYPVTSKVYIEDTDKNIRFSVFPDRSQGCTSLNEGQLDLMLHRRILTDDSRVNGAVNETILEGKGLIVRGNHRLYVSKADYRPNKIYEKKLAKELHLQPLVFTSNHPLFDKINTHSVWSSCRNEYTAIKKKLPIGIHVLSFEKWSDELLIRLENYLEKSDVVKAGVKKVNILGLFKDYVITFCRETMLGTNIWKSDYVKMQWQRDRFVKNFNDVYGNSSNLVFAEDEMTGYESVDLINGIELAPQQIRTFVCSYEKPSILGA